MRALTSNKASVPRGMALVVLAMLAAFGSLSAGDGGWLMPEAVAQQAGRSAGGGAIGPSQGTVGGGHTGAANQGGAGGGNPSPGADAGNLGGTGGEGSATVSARPGYVGGREVPSDGGDVPVVSHTEVSLTQIAMTCSYVTPQGMSPEARLGGDNGARLGAVSAHFMPAGDEAAARAGRSLLAGYQEALAGEQHDPVLAGTYLGLLAKTEVTADAVQQVSASLCVPIGLDEAEAIANIAEGQRLKIEAEMAARAGQVEHATR